MSDTPERYLTPLKLVDIAGDACDVYDAKDNYLCQVSFLEEKTPIAEVMVAAVNGMADQEWFDKECGELRIARPYEGHNGKSERRAVTWRAFERGMTTWKLVAQGASRWEALAKARVQIEERERAREAFEDKQDVPAQQSSGTTYAEEAAGQRGDRAIRM
jgi:hypothetical protein